MLDFSSAPINPPQHQIKHENDDLPALKQYLNDTLETWVPRLLPEVKLISSQFRAGSLSGERGSSFVLKLTGQDRGMWIDHATGENGDCIELIMKNQQTDFQGALAIARDIANIPMHKVTPKELKMKEERRRQFNAEMMGQIIREIKYHYSAGFAGAVASEYLRRRRLRPPQDFGCNDLMCHPNLLHYPTQRRFPCLVALVRDVEGKIIGLHRTYIDPTTNRKADVEPNKMMLCDCRGGAVRLGQITNDGVLGISEGIETGLAAMQTFGIPVWAALSTSGMRALNLPKEATRIIIFSDMDPDGKAAANELAHTLTHEGRRVSIAFPKHGDDFAHDLEVEHDNRL